MLLTARVDRRKAKAHDGHIFKELWLHSLSLVMDVHNSMGSNSEALASNSVGAWRLRI